MINNNKTLTKLILSMFLFVFFLNNNTYSQTTPIIEWSKMYGSPSLDYVFGITNNHENGFLTYGYINSGESWLQKTDENGNLEWEKFYQEVAQGSYLNHAIYDVKKTNDGGYIVLENYQYNGFDSRIFKTDAFGNITWTKLFNSGYNSNHDFFNEILITPDNGYIIAGYSSGNYSDSVFNTNYNTGINSEDGWVIKLDYNGNIQWKKNYGSPNKDTIIHITALENGDFILSGQTYEQSNPSRFWVLRIDFLGNIIWNKKFGGVAPKNFNSKDICKTIVSKTNEIFAIGKTNLLNPGVDNEISSNTVLKISLTTGDLIWEKSYNDPVLDNITDIALTYDNGLVTLGSHKKTPIFPDNDYSDLWIMRLDNDGNKIWENYYNEGKSDLGNEILIVNNNQFVVSSNPISSYFVTNGGTDYDLNILKFTPDTTINLNYNPIEEEEEEENQNPNLGYTGNDCDKILFFPNPINFNIINTNYKTSVPKCLRIFDIRSRLIVNDCDFKNQKELFLHSGVYLAQILENDIVVCQKKIIIENKN